jgi:hypothetical protein
MRNVQPAPRAIDPVEERPVVDDLDDAGGALAAAAADGHAGKLLPLFGRWAKGGLPLAVFDSWRRLGHRVDTMKRTAVSLVVSLALAFAAGTAEAAAPALYKNCTNLNKRYPHGVGKLLARDKAAGEPVTNFKRSTRLYLVAMSYNKGLDRDKDGIACEKL